MIPTPVIEFQGVSKTYTCGWWVKRPVQALRDVTLRVEPGEVFGLLGPNRAGKTTLVKLLLALCPPTAGRVFRFGRPADDRRTLARVGYLHERHAFPRYLTAARLLELCGALALMPPEVLRERVPALLARVGLADAAGQMVARFSKGMVQRLALAQALLSDPLLLVLDEPSEGLDLDGRRLVREVVQEQRRQGRSVLLVSHVLGEAEKLCDRVGVLVEGRLVHVGPVAALTRTRSGAARPIEHALQELYQEKAPA
jgi:ABC-2 type transport system ATP-binding protein